MSGCPPPGEEGPGDSGVPHHLLRSPHLRTPAKALGPQLGRLALSGKPICLRCLRLSGVHVLWGAEVRRRGTPRISGLLPLPALTVFQGRGWALVPLFFGTGNRIEEGTGGFQVFLKDSPELRAVWEVPGLGRLPTASPQETANTFP